MEADKGSRKTVTPRQGRKNLVEVRESEALGLGRTEHLPNMDEWSDEQIAGFWESHDAADFWEEMQPVDLTFSRARKRKRKQIRLTLTEMQWQRLSELANRKGTTPESLVRQWIEKELQAVK
jgi:hypothetical protein